MDILLKNHLPYEGYGERFKRAISDRRILDEECHIFSGQYECADIIAKKVLSAISSGIAEITVDYDCGSFKHIFIKIYCSEDYSSFNLCKGNIYALNKEESTIKITLFVNSIVLAKTSRNKAEQEISSVIIHEMMHGNVFMSRIASKSKRIKAIDDNPSYYEKVNWLSQNSKSEAVSDFARALYLANYNESQAMISQGWKETKYQLRLFTHPYSMENFKSAFMETPIRKDFSKAIDICKNMLAYPKLRDFVFKNLEENDIVLSGDSQKIVRNICNKLEKAFRTLVRSCCHYFLKACESPKS